VTCPTSERWIGSAALNAVVLGDAARGSAGHPVTAARDQGLEEPTMCADSEGHSEQNGKLEVTRLVQIHEPSLCH
jgi:hypothetical protein